jgi:hypothetical protein
MILLIGTWCAYVAGAATGAAGLASWGLFIVAAPVVALLLLAILELISPK